MTDFFSGSKPDLISLKTINDLAVLAGGDSATQIIKPVIKKTDIKSIYNNYIKPNIVPIVLIVAFLLFLLVRYMTLKDTQINNTTLKNKEEFNAAQSVYEQPNHNNYVSGDAIIYDLEDNIDENELIEKIKAKTEMPFDEHIEEDKLRNKEMEFEDCDDNSREIIYKGRSDWLNQDDGFPNPFFGNNLVSSTGAAVQFGLQKNQNSIDVMAKKIFS